MIVRSPRARNFTVIGNEIFDSGLSLEAIGLLCYLLSRPDNWRILPAQLADKFSGGRDRTYRILRELVDAFYISRKKLTTGAMEYTVFDVPTPDPENTDKAEAMLPFPEKPDLGFPDQGKPDPEKADVLLKTESKQTLKYNQRTDDWPDDAWEQFWAIYPNKVGKPVAMKSFEKARLRFPVWAEFWAGVLRYVNKTDDRSWLNPSTFLNQDRAGDMPAALPVRGGGGPGRQSFMGAARAAMANGGFDGQ